MWVYITLGQEVQKVKLYMYRMYVCMDQCIYVYVCEGHFKVPSSSSSRVQVQVTKVEISHGSDATVEVRVGISGWLVS